MKCKFCSGQTNKQGKYKEIQLFYCKSCKKTFREFNKRRTHNLDDYRNLIIKLNNEGVGIRSMSRILNIPFQTVLRMMTKISDELMLNKKKEN